MSNQPPLRSLPRVFLPGQDMSAPFELPSSEADKLRKVLRMTTGDPFAVLPNDGSLWECRLDGKSAIPESQEFPNTEPSLKLALAQALPKGDRLETVLRMGTEIGVSRFILFPAERSVVRWEAGKLEAKLQRLRTIVREAAEQCFRSILPEVSMTKDLGTLLKEVPDAIVLSEVETETQTLANSLKPGLEELTLVVGPEGGWSLRELEQIGKRGVTLGPLVLRTDTAGPAAAAAVLFGLYAAWRKNSDKA
jgi:16S rRNA (uracil1498-N3)-methyltransferase